MDHGRRNFLLGSLLEMFTTVAVFHFYMNHCEAVKRLSAGAEAFSIEAVSSEEVSLYEDILRFLCA